MALVPALGVKRPRFVSQFVAGPGIGFRVRWDWVDWEFLLFWRLFACGGQDVWMLSANPATIRGTAARQGDCADTPHALRLRGRRVIMCVFSQAVCM